MLTSIRLLSHRLLWWLRPIRQPDLYPGPEGTLRNRADEILISRARTAMRLRNRRLALRILRRHSLPDHAYRWVEREMNEARLEQGRRAWAEHQAEIATAKVERETWKATRALRQAEPQSASPLDKAG